MPDPQVEERKPEWAYIVGGYPQRFRAIELRLQKLHINVNGHCDTPGQFQVPKSTTLIIIITDQCSHTNSEKARTYAKQFKLPIIGGSYKNWCNMETRLESFGFGYRSLELVAGGQEIITTEQSESPQAKLGDLFSKEKRAELEKKIAPPEPVPVVQAVKKTGKTQQKSLQMQEAIRAAIDVNKDHLETYTNNQLARDVSELLGYPVSMSGVALWRKKWKIKQTPKGYKSPKIPVAPKLDKVVAPEISDSDVESTIDSYQKQLNAFVAKYQISKLHIIYENGEWKTDWAQVTVVSKQKTYK